MLHLHGQLSTLTCVQQLVRRERQCLTRNVRDHDKRQLRGKYQNEHYTPGKTQRRCTRVVFFVGPGPEVNDDADGEGTDSVKHVDQGNA